MNTLTRSTVVNFVLGMIAGAVLAAMLVSHILASRVAESAALNGRAIEQQAQITDTIQKTADVWRGRAQNCESRFTVGTVILEPHPVAEIPLLHGVASVSINAGEVRPSWFIPAQVRVYTNIPGARYQWQDMRSGEFRGEFEAMPPAAMAQSANGVQ